MLKEKISAQILKYFLWNNMNNVIRIEKQYFQGELICIHQIISWHRIEVTTLP